MTELDAVRLSSEVIELCNREGVQEHIKKEFIKGGILKEINITIDIKVG